MNLYETVMGLPKNDREAAIVAIRSFYSSKEGLAFFGMLDALVTGHIDPLGSSGGALIETNAQRSLIAQMKLIAEIKDGGHARNNSRGRTNARNGGGTSGDSGG